MGVTHECDYPPGVESLPHLTRSRIPAAAPSAEIDAMVAAQGGSLYDLDAATLAELRPDLILTQEQCDVCAVNEATVRRAAASLPGSPARSRASTRPTWTGVFAMFRRVGDLLDAARRGRSARSPASTTGRRDRPPVERAADPSRPAPGMARPAVLLGPLEPRDHRAAGGREVLGRAGRARRGGSPGTRSPRPTPTSILLAACGFTVDRAEAEFAGARRPPEWRASGPSATGRVALTDGSAYFSRPGPRLETASGSPPPRSHPERLRRPRPGRIGPVAPALGG